MARRLKMSGRDSKPGSGSHPRRMSEKRVMERWEELNRHLQSAEPIRKPRKR